MLNASCRVNPNENKAKSTPLHLAVNQENEAAVRILIQSRHCDVNCQVSGGWAQAYSKSALTRRTKREVLPILSCVLCRPNTFGYDCIGTRWMHDSVSLKHEAHCMSKVIIRQTGPAKICDLPDEKGEYEKTHTRLNDFQTHLNAFQFFSYFPFHEEGHIWWMTNRAWLQLWISGGTNLGIFPFLTVSEKKTPLVLQDVAGDTPLHDAISKGKDGIVNALMASPILDATVCNSKGFNPLHWACLKGNKKWDCYTSSEVHLTSTICHKRCTLHHTLWHSTVYNALHMHWYYTLLYYV